MFAAGRNEYHAAILPLKSILEVGVIIVFQTAELSTTTCTLLLSIVIGYT